MNLNMKDAVLWLGVVCLGLLPLPTASGQQPRLRDTLGAGHSAQALGAGISCVAFAPDGKTLASASKDTIMLWDVANKKVTATLQGDGLQVTSVAFSPDGKTLASGHGNRGNPGQGGHVKLWDVGSRKNTATLREQPAIDGSDPPSSGPTVSAYPAVQRKIMDQTPTRR